MTSPLIRKLERHAHLSAADRIVLEGFGAGGKAVPRHHHLIREGDDPRAVFLLLEGWAMRYKILPDGGRQIVGFLIPGDLCDMHIFILTRMDHNIAMLSPGRVATISRDTITEVIDCHPAIARALWWTTLVDEAILREWLVNIGGRDAHARIAHLFCEMGTRMDNVGLLAGGRYQLPLGQVEIGEALGLTNVHVNRTLQRMRKEGLVALESRELTILDAKALGQAAGFDSTYMHARPQEAPDRPRAAERESVGAG